MSFFNEHVPQQDVPTISVTPKPKYATCFLYRGISLSLLGSLMMSFGSVAIKSIESLNGTQLAFFRFICLFPIVLTYLIFSRQSTFGPSASRFPLVCRSVLGGLALLFMYNAFKSMPIGEVSVVTSTTPIFVTILARIFLKEPTDCWFLLSIAMTTVGLCLLARLPEMFFESSLSRFQDIGYWKGLSFATGSAVISAVVIVVTRSLSKTVHTSVILFNFTWIALIELGLINALIPGKFQLPKCGSESWLVVLLAIVSFSGQMCITKALRYENAGTVALVRFSAPVFILFLFQTFIFHEPPDAYSISASILILASVISVTYRKYWVGKEEKKAAKLRVEFEENIVQETIRTL